MFDGIMRHVNKNKLVLPTENPGMEQVHFKIGAINGRYAVINLLLCNCGRSRVD